MSGWDLINLALLLMSSLLGFCALIAAMLLALWGLRLAADWLKRARGRTEAALVTAGVGVALLLAPFGEGMYAALLAVWGGALASLNARAAGAAVPGLVLVMVGLAVLGFVSEAWLVLVFAGTGAMFCAYTLREVMGRL